MKRIILLFAAGLLLAGCKKSEDTSGTQTGTNSVTATNTIPNP